MTSGQAAFERAKLKSGRSQCHARLLSVALPGGCTWHARGHLYHETVSHSPPRSPPNPANAPSTRFFGDVGITAGARVLDVGCGNGDLSRYVAGLAGPSGEVVAIDRSEQALATARTIDADPGAAHIQYRAVDLSGDLPDLGRFDAIVGRRVLESVLPCLNRFGILKGSEA